MKKFKLMILNTYTLLPHKLIYLLTAILLFSCYPKLLLADPFYPAEVNNNLQAKEHFSTCEQLNSKERLYPELTIKQLKLIGILRHAKTSLVLFKIDNTQIISLSLQQVIGLEQWQLIAIEQNTVTFSYFEPDNCHIKKITKLTL